MKKIFFLLTVMSVLFVACSSDDDSNSRIEYEVFIEIYKDYLNELTNSENPILLDKYTYNSGKYIRYGLWGVFAFKKSPDNYIVYDGACPVEWTNEMWTQALIFIKENNIGQCSLCNSKFDLSTGNPIEGKAKDEKIKLVMYTITQDPNNENIYIIDNTRYDW